MPHRKLFKIATSTVAIRLFVVVKTTVRLTAENTNKWGEQPKKTQWTVPQLDLDIVNESKSFNWVFFCLLWLFTWCNASADRIWLLLLMFESIQFMFETHIFGFFLRCLLYIFSWWVVNWWCLLVCSNSEYVAIYIYSATNRFARIKSTKKAA